MLVPKKVKVAGHTYKVQYDTKRLIKDGLVGDAHHGTHIISLSKLNTDESISNPSYIEDTFRTQLKSFVGTEVGRQLVLEIISPEAIKPGESKAKDSKTLTRKAATTSPTPRERVMTDEESIAEAAKLLQYSED